LRYGLSNSLTTLNDIKHNKLNRFIESASNQQRYCRRCSLSETMQTFSKTVYKSYGVWRFALEKANKMEK